MRKGLEQAALLLLCHTDTRIFDAELEYYIAPIGFPGLHAHYNLAEALAVVGDLERARKHWRAYLTFDPNSRWAEQVRQRLRKNGSS